MSLHYLEFRGNERKGTRKKFRMLCQPVDQSVILVNDSFILFSSSVVRSEKWHEVVHNFKENIWPVDLLGRLNKRANVEVHPQ